MCRNVFHSPVLDEILRHRELHNSVISQVQYSEIRQHFSTGVCTLFPIQKSTHHSVPCTLYKALYMMALYMEAFLLIFSCLDLGGFSTLSMTSRLLILTKKQEELNYLKHDSNYPSIFTVASGTV